MASGCGNTMPIGNKQMVGVPVLVSAGYTECILVTFSYQIEAPSSSRLIVVVPC
jgi:hypothetical protein